MAGIQATTQAATIFTRCTWTSFCYLTSSPGSTRSEDHLSNSLSSKLAIWAIHLAHSWWNKGVAAALLTHTSTAAVTSNLLSPNSSINNNSSRCHKTSSSSNQLMLTSSSRRSWWPYSAVVAPLLIRRWPCSSKSCSSSTTRSVTVGQITKPRDSRSRCTINSSNIPWVASNSHSLREQEDPKPQLQWQQPQPPQQQPSSNSSNKMYTLIPPSPLLIIIIWVATTADSGRSTKPNNSSKCCSLAVRRPSRFDLTTIRRRVNDNLSVSSPPRSSILHNTFHLKCN